MPAATAGSAVKVLEDRVVAGFRAVVLEARSGDDLADWLKANAYAFSPEVRAWAKAYVEQGWKMTALKAAKAKSGGSMATAPATGGDAGRDVSAAALRMSFKTDRPLFPYRKPDPTGPARALGASRRLLRIYFIAEARYGGELTPEQPWTGRDAWSGRMTPTDRERTLDLLKLPEVDRRADWWLTEFEDDWPYRPAPADVCFTRAADQSAIKRPPIVQYALAAPLGGGDVLPFMLVIGMACVSPLARRFIRRRSG